MARTGIPRLDSNQSCRGMDWTPMSVVLQKILLSPSSLVGAGLVTGEDGRQIGEQRVQRKKNEARWKGDFKEGNLGRASRLDWEGGRPGAAKKGQARKHQTAARRERAIESGEMQKAGTERGRKD